jgi:spermidine/putrescine transport system permease protein
MRSLSRGRSRPGVRRYALSVFVFGVFLYVLTPIITMVAYSFNVSPAAARAAAPKVSFRWQGFTTEWYRTWNAVPDLVVAMKNSLMIAAASTAVAVVLGSLLALALGRYRVRGRSAVSGLLFVNVAVPELVLGASLLSLFVLSGVQLGLPTIFLAHVTFSIAYVTITVRARISEGLASLEDAARDLYATPWHTFRLVTLPHLMPGIVAGALLAFALSIDEYVTTSFVAGQTVTFPLWVYGSVKVGIPPQVFVLGTFIFVGSLVVATAFTLARMRPSRSGP